PDVVLKSCIEEIYLPQVDYLSTSSPLISEAYKKIFPAKQPVTILNTFKIDKRIQHPSINDSGAIRMFWFSQTIGINRGLEEVLIALKTLAGYSFELHLLGYLSSDMKDLLDEYRSSLKIYIHKPLPPDEIPFFASQFDIGLATENTHPYNRDICLTNKIFTYLCAGLAIVASNTQAQAELIKKYPATGKLYQSKDPGSLAEILLHYYANRGILNHSRQAAVDIANSELNWQNESKKFLTLIKQTLK
ncbi:MAG TPA: hypothetical protein VL442_04995, partial [Mucilaginibacter sp.]|nr:hypothetical protein [Mucilaginibacter sp.]